MPGAMQQWSVSALCQGRTPSRAYASVSLYGNSVLMFGGSNQDGVGTDSLYLLDLAAMAKGQGWSLLDCKGDVPSPRWGHSAFVYEDRLWVYGGFGPQQAVYEDMYCLDLATCTWEMVQQDGAAPNRQLGKHKSFHPAVLAPAGHAMLAFGLQHQDPENTDPSRPATSPALRLHAFDLNLRKWSNVHATGGLPFQKLEALQCNRNKLVAVGWSNATGKSDSDMKVCFLDLSSITSCRTPSFSLGSARSRPTPSWTIVQAHGMTPSARTSAAAAVLGDQLLLHGGMLVSKSVAGRLSQDTFCLNLSTSTWTRMAASQERAVGSTSINVARASHMAVAVPAVAAVMLIGGTNNRQAWASCDSIECLRQIGGGPVASTDSSDGISAAVAAAGMGLSGTPTLLGIQPFAHVTNTPRFMQTLVAGSPQTGTPSTPTGRLPVATPAVQLTSTPGASAEAAATAAAPSSDLVPVFDFGSFCFNHMLSDVELVAGGRSFPAHRLLLCAQSPRLAQLIEAQVAANNQAQIPDAECKWTLHLPDVYPDVLALMLKYMYCSLTSIRAEAAPLLFKAADRYGLSGLRAACLKVVIATIDLDNVCHNMLLAHDLKVSELSQACILFVAASPERFHQVLATPGYLTLNQSHPRVGTAFVQACTQLLMAKTG